MENWNSSNEEIIRPADNSEIKGCFVKLSAKSTINTSLVIHTRPKKFGSDFKAPSTSHTISQVPNPILCGISSFQGFVMSSANVISTGTITIGDTSSRIKAEPLSVCEENILKQLPAVYPNILKRKELKKEMESTSPMKPLAFSPSRFLNTNVDGKEDYFPPTEEMSKDLSFSNSTFDVEDSGIGGSDIDATAPLSPPSLTSTPCTRSRRKIHQRSLFLSPEQDSFSERNVPFQSTPKNDRDPNKTPLIRKFLNESAPQTPTPFKCPEDTSNIGDLTIPHNSSTKRNDDALMSPEEEFCFKRPSPVTSRSSRRWGNSSDRSKSKKTARKALVLDRGDKIKRNLFKRDENENVMHISPKINCTALKSSYTSQFDQSSLIEDTTIVEKRKIVSAGKSVFCTRRRKLNEQLKGLDKKWVSVACGHSFDQKVMTEAAKRCLRHRPNRINYSL